MAQGVLGSPLPKGSDQVDQAVGVVQRSHRQLPFEEIGREVEIEKENGRFISSDDSLFMQMDQLTNLLEQFRIRLEKKKRPALRLPSPTPDDDRAQDDLNPAALRSDPILPPYLMDDQGPEDGLNWTSLRRERPPQAVTPPPHGTYRPLIEHSALASFRCSTRTEEEIRAEDSISCRGIDDDDDADRNIGSFGGDGGRDGRGRRMRDLICGLLEEEEREEAARSRPDATTVTGGSETLVQRSTLGGTLGGTSSSLGLLEPIDLTSHVGVVAARREMHRPVVEVRRTPAASAGGGQGRWGGRSFGSASSRSAGGGGTDESVGVVVNGPTVNSEAIPRRRDDGARERRSPKDAEREPASSRDSGRQEDRDQPPPLSFMSPHIREPKPSRLSPMLPPRPIASPKMTSPSAALASSTSSSSTPPTIAEMMLLRLQSQTSLPAEMPRILFEPGSGFVSSVDGSAVWGLDEASRESAAAFGYVGGGGGEAGAAGAEEGDTMVMERALRPVMEKYLKGLRVEKAGGGGGGGGGERRKHGAGRIV
ncbi:hypothetical protein HK101_010575 [Irineochytrium annulatum]|nr:hypothetical protein HK101_010575 [Irineochytrium annulatum]